MELWIKSSVGCFLMKADMIHLVEENRFNIYGYNGTASTTGNILGSYESKERALEVLNGIQELLQTRHCYATNYIEANLVYEMPQD